MALALGHLVGQPLGLAALNSEGLRNDQVLRVPVLPVRHQLNSLCNRGGTLLYTQLLSVLARRPTATAVATLL